MVDLVRSGRQSFFTAAAVRGLPVDARRAAPSVGCVSDPSPVGRPDGARIVSFERELTQWRAGRIGHTPRERGSHRLRDSARPAWTHPGRDGDSSTRPLARPGFRLGRRRRSDRRAPERASVDRPLRPGDRPRDPDLEIANWATDEAAVPRPSTSVVALPVGSILLASNGAASSALPRLKTMCPGRDVLGPVALEQLRHRAGAESKYCNAAGSVGADAPKDTQHSVATREQPWVGQFRIAEGLRGAPRVRHTEDTAVHAIENRTVVCPVHAGEAGETIQIGDGHRRPSGCGHTLDLPLAAIHEHDPLSVWREPRGMEAFCS